MISARAMLLLIKPEATYADDAAPVGANAFIASDVTIKPLAGETENRNFIQPYMGGTPDIHVGEHIELNFTLENQSSGAAGTAPPIAPALIAAGCLETVDPGVSVIYTPQSNFDDHGSATVYFYIGNILHKVVGVRGDFDTSFAPSKLSRIPFKMFGLWAGPVSEAPPTPDYSAFAQPLPVGPWHSSDFELFSLTSLTAHKLDFKAGWDASYHPTITTEEIRLANRESSVSLTIDLPPLATKDFITAIRNGETGNLSLQHGQVAGQIVVFDAPKAQPMEPNYGEIKGVRTLEMTAKLLPVTGDDEWSFTYK